MRASRLWEGTYPQTPLTVTAFADGDVRINWLSGEGVTVCHSGVAVTLNKGTHIICKLSPSHLSQGTMYQVIPEGDWEIMCFRDSFAPCGAYEAVFILGRPGREHREMDRKVGRSPTPHVRSG